MKRSFFHNIIFNAGSKIISAAITLVLIVIGSRELGAEGMGEISLVVLSITIAQLFNGVLAGSSMVYLTARYPVFLILRTAIAWNVFANFIIIPILWAFALFPETYLWHTITLGIAAGLGQAGINIMLGKERILLQSIVGIVQSLVQLVFIMIVFYGLRLSSVAYFIDGLIILNTIPFLACIAFFRNELFARQPPISFRAFLKESSGYSIFIQSASAAQLLNYRLSYYFIEFLWGTATLGLFSVSVQIAEGILVIPRSLSTVLYSRIANTLEMHYASRLTLAVIKFAMCITAVFFLVIFCVPANVYSWIFGDEFITTKMLLMILSPGIIVLSATTVISAYFAGRGKPSMNTMGSLTGLVVTAAIGYVLVDRFDLKGAALMMILSYAASFIYSIYVFRRMSLLSWKEILYSGYELQLLRSFIGRLFAKNKQIE